jgi:hypothetical protein
VRRADEGGGQQHVDVDATTILQEHARRRHAVDAVDVQREPNEV